MSDQTTAAPTTEPHDLGPGLVEYYSSQADLMLSQYKNINHLLGPTHDWTHPGDFCEILFRDFLRKFLPPSLSADKGFFYGRATLDGKIRTVQKSTYLFTTHSNTGPSFGWAISSSSSPKPWSA